MTAPPTDRPPTLPELVDLAWLLLAIGTTSLLNDGYLLPQCIFFDADHQLTMVACDRGVDVRSVVRYHLNQHRFHSWLVLTDTWIARNLPAGAKPEDFPAVKDIPGRLEAMVVNGTSRPHDVIFKLTQVYDRTIPDTGKVTTLHEVEYIDSQQPGVRIRSWASRIPGH